MKTNTSEQFNLESYRDRMSSEQFALLERFLSYARPGNYDPAEFFYPDDLWIDAHEERKEIL